MFTGARIALSELAGPLGLDLRRDAAIAYVGKVPTRLPDRLVPCGKPEHLAATRTETGITACVVPEGLVAEVPPGWGVIVADRPVHEAMRVQEHLAVLEGFQWQDFDSRIDPTAIIAPSAVIAPRNVVIGPRTVIGAHAVIEERTLIGADCTIGPGTVLGMPAFEQMVGASPKRILRQSGGVRLADWVSIGANGTISRATFGGFTEIGRETKIDARVYLAHDGQVGERVTICASCCINGRCEVSDDAYLGPNCTISNGLRVGARATVSLGATVTRDVPPGTRVSGPFALPHAHALNLLRDYR